MKVISAVRAFIFVCSLICICSAEQIGYIDISNEPMDGETTFEIACNFYGLEIERLPKFIFDNDDRIISVLNKKKFQAIAIAESSLRVMQSTAQSKIYRMLRLHKIPLLIFGISPNTNPDILSNWSQGLIGTCQNINRSAIDGYYQTDKIRSINRQLSGIEFPYIGKYINYLYYDDKKVKPIIQVSDKTTSCQFPIFVKIEVEGQEIFFLTENQLNKTAELPRGRKSYGKKDLDYSISRYDHNILQLLPFLIFLRYTCDQMCWHSSAHFANLTIDDPWLTEPYGFLNFRKLLEQMKIYNFHTTIGFIPWNYDRSTKAVVDLFIENQDRYSICLHGNNHDQREFPKYESESDGSWASSSLAKQEEDIKQALARMDKFRAITGVPYDKIMIFPHGIAPADTLGLLKRYNFLATVNATNVPLGSSVPSDILFQLRSLTMNYDKFPSLRRDPPDRSIADIALDLFLDNPILFYAHHDYFKSGAHAFDEVAEKVNWIQPGIRWQSLGNIIQHFYLEKQIDADNYEVMAFSDRIVISNNNQRDLKYHIHKEDSIPSSVKRIMMNDRAYPYQSVDDIIEFDIFLPKGESRQISIEYLNEPDTSSVNISTEDPRIRRLRGLSDFRDMKLSKNLAGRILIKSYYETGLYKYGIKNLLISFLILLAVSCFGIIVIIRKRRG